MNETDIQELETLLDTKVKSCPISPIYNHYLYMFFSNTHRYSIAFTDHDDIYHLYIDRIGENDQTPNLKSTKIQDIINEIKNHYDPTSPYTC